MSVGAKFSSYSGKSLALCDYCGFQYLLKQLKRLTINTQLTDIKVCPSCYTPDQPQWQVGRWPVDDAQATRDPRPDTSYWQSGLNGLQLTLTDFGYPGEGSRVIQWGWNPVGLTDPLHLTGLQNTLVASGQVGTVTVETS